MIRSAAPWTGLGPVIGLGRSLIITIGEAKLITIGEAKLITIGEAKLITIGEAKRDCRLPRLRARSAHRTAGAQRGRQLPA